ncbi:MAG: hypothetical protein CVU39_26195 [Chloroflexi bacterium HGW-Chloroflexi-10]|nr:MAG: hypothetical protein CVU39_26195 [Chloroflexi bacterium HGW-Chloroflexi-10]
MPQFIYGILRIREGKMLIRRSGSLILAIVLIFSTLACNLLSLKEDHSPDPQEVGNILNAASTEETVFSEVRPANTAVTGSAPDIEIDYIYTDGLITSLYHLYGNVLDHFVDITLTNNGNESVTLLVETNIEGYSTTSSDTIDVAPNDQVTIHQNPRLIPDAVDKLNSEQPGNFHIQVTQLNDGEDNILLKESSQILLYSRRDYVWISGFETQENYEFFAAWITPTDPAVEELIRHAADYTSSGMMWSGYGGNVNDESGGVWERLEAIWLAEEHNYNITYISTMIAFGPNTVQRMRMPYEVIDQASGNCIELANLYASAAEALGLEAAIIRIPGHAYIGVRMDEENANYYFIETTLIGQTDFSQAVDVGKQEWEETLPHLDAQEEGYAWIEIAEAREKGILPMPWR